MNELAKISYNWKVNQNTTTQNTGQQYMSYLSRDGMWNLSLHLGVASSIFLKGFKINCRTGPHDERKPPFLCLSSFFILLSSNLDFFSTFFVWNGLEFTNTFFIRNGLDFTRTLFLSKWTGLNWVFLLFQGQEAQSGTRRTPLGSILRETTLYCSRFRAWAKSKIIWP